MNEEEFFNKYVMGNPFNLKKSIIAHCRTLDKYDVYQWVADDEVKIKNLLEENQQLKEQLELSEQIREKQKDRMNRVKDKIQSVAYGGSEDYYVGIINEIHKLLCVIKEKKE